MTEEMTDRKRGRDDLKEAIYKLLPSIDARLANSETPLKQRAFQAAAIFVKEFVVTVSGEDNKDDFATKPWFAIVYHHFDAWYREHYSDALEKEHSNIACGVVLVRDVAVELAVPLTRGRVETPGETAWLFFPIEVEADEDPISWLKNSPNLTRLDDADKIELRTSATHVAAALRAIRINLMGIEPSDEKVIGLLDGVLPEFESAARQILRSEKTGRASALWSLQIAIERTLKAYAQHKSGSFRQTHNLFELFDDLARYDIKADRNLLKKIPRDQDVIEDRYGLRGTPSIWEVFESYKAAVQFVAAMSGSFRRKFNVGGGGFLLRKAPWITLPTPESLIPRTT